MRKGIMPFLFSFATIALSSSAAHATIVMGTSGQINGSTVSAFANVTGNHLNTVGFQLSGNAVRAPGAAPDELFLTLPPQAHGTGFTVLGLEWNPQGHEPPGVYDLPHFDLHFYYISDALRTTIPGGQITPLDPKFLPAGYSQPGPTVPMMGGHSVDLTSAEFNGGIFTQTLIYGFYQGQEIFVEPMATQDYLTGLVGSTNFMIRQPSEYAITMLPSLVPTNIEYKYDAANDLYTISLGGFVDPVPEPSGLALLAFAIPAAMWFGKRRTRKAGT